MVGTTDTVRLRPLLSRHSPSNSRPSVAASAQPASLRPFFAWKAATALAAQEAQFDQRALQVGHQLAFRPLVQGSVARGVGLAGRVGQAAADGGLRHVPGNAVVFYNVVAAAFTRDVNGIARGQRQQRFRVRARAFAQGRGGFHQSLEGKIRQRGQRGANQQRRDQQRGRQVFQMLGKHGQPPVTYLYSVIL